MIPGPFLIRSCYSFFSRHNILPPVNQPRPSHQLIQKGDTFKWKWHNWNFEESGSVLEANGKDEIAGGNVSINLKAVAKGTEVLLTQDNIRRSK